MRVVIAEDQALLRTGRPMSFAERRICRLTQEDIAGLAGTSRATTNRVLREAAARGVRLERGRTVVLDVSALRRHAGIR